MRNGCVWDTYDCFRYCCCHEMLDSYPNVLFIDNNRFDCQLNDIPEPLISPDFSFSVENTIHKEIELIQKYL